MNFTDVLNNPIAAKLAAIRGARIVTFTTATVPKMNKSGAVPDPTPRMQDGRKVFGFMRVVNPYFGRVVKHSRVNAVINFDYVTAATKAADKQGDVYVPGPSSYIHIVKIDDNGNECRTPFLTDKKTASKIYVQLKPLGTKSFYTCDGQEIDKAELAPFFPEYREQLTPVRAYFVDSLLELTVDGQDYRPEIEPAQLQAILDAGISAIRQRLALVTK